MFLHPWVPLLVLGLGFSSVLISFSARRFTRTTLDFYLAGRKIGFFVNASAIGGDYFSAASFLGVAAAVYASGLDGLWFAVGFAAGFVPVAVFVAAPLSRFGEYTIPDFLAARFQSSALRIFGALMVQIITIFYLTPQIVGAGSIWGVLVGQGFFGLSPYATGAVLSAVVMILYVTLGGMKGTTWNQMVQFWVLFLAMALVVSFAHARGFRYGRDLKEVSGGPLLTARTMTVYQALRPDGRGVVPLEESRPYLAREAAMRVEALVREERWQEEVVLLLPSPNRLAPDRYSRFNEAGHWFNMVDQVSLILALALGTAGLPHIMNRYYTNPSGRVARITTVWVLGLVGSFYVLASMAGVAARSVIHKAAAVDPQVTQLTFGGVLLNADQAMPVLARVVGGELLLGVVAAGAFAAMFSTAGGLLMAAAASLGHDIYETYVNPQAPERRKVAVGKAAVMVIGLLALVMGLFIRQYGLEKAYPSLIAIMVTWAFSIAGASFVPAFLTSMWWKGTTRNGVLAGMAFGGLGTVVLIVLNVLREMGMVSPASWPGMMGILTFPSILMLPLTVAIIVTVSLLDRQLPENVDAIWLRIHGTARERFEQRWTRLSA